MAFVVILAVSLLSAYRTLGFYFWHDDFSVLYSARLGECIFKWPYQSYCPIFTFLDRFFNYNSYYYFTLGFLLLVFASFSLYVFLNNYFKEKISVLTTLVFSSMYIGAGILLETFDSITLFLSMGLLFQALNFLAKALIKKLRLKYLVLSLILFVLSIVALPARSATYFVPFLILIFFHPRGLTLVKKIFLIVLFVLIFLSFYLFLPLGFGSVNTGSGMLGYFLKEIDIVAEFDQLLKSLSSFLLPESLGINNPLVRSTIGSAVLFLFLEEIYRGRKSFETFKNRLLAGVWVLALYLPYALRSDWTLESTSRYLLPSFPGVLLFWSTFGNKKHWNLVTIGIIIFGIINSNYYFTKHMRFSSQRRDFYNQLHTQLKILPKNSVLFIDFGKEVKNIGNDFLRVGYTPPESAIATGYRTNYQDLTLVTESAFLRELIKNKRATSENLITFYYNNQGLLVETTSLSRQLLMDHTPFVFLIGKNGRSSFIFNEDKDQWSGVMNPLELEVKTTTFKPVLPFKLRIVARAFLPVIPLPFSQDCFKDCFYDPSLYDLTVNFSIQKKEIKKEMGFGVSDFSEEAFGAYLSDDNKGTYWLSDRQKWFRSEKPVVKINYGRNRNLDGLILYSKPDSRKPVSFEIDAGGQKVDYRLVDYGLGIVKLLFEERVSGPVSLSILSTYDGDSPLLYEIDPIPSGFTQINPLDIEKIKDAPASQVKTKRDTALLSRFLSNGVKACVKWQNAGYGSSTENFELVVDGRVHTYDIPMPSMGLEMPVFTLNCINYPINIYIDRLEIVS